MQSKPKLGQHWLIDPKLLKTMLDVADISARDEVLEVGPGQGVLTQKLAAAGATVTAVEIDDKLADKLQASFKDSRRINIIQADIRSYDLNQLPADYKVVANIPYYLTAPLINKFILADNPPERLVLMVQKEVAQRLTAGPGGLSVLALVVQMFGSSRLVMTIGPAAFSPPPKVDSALLLIERRAGPSDLAAKMRLLPLIKHGFANRRKTLSNSLSAGLSLPKSEVSAALKRSGLSASVRAQDLELKDWRRLQAELKL